MCCLRIASAGRVLQNIGGIANLTAIPAGAGPDAVVAFDTGPGNMVIDALAHELLGKAFDRNGACAAQGTVLKPVLQQALGDKYFRFGPRARRGGSSLAGNTRRSFLAACRKLVKKS